MTKPMKWTIVFLAIIIVAGFGLVLKARAAADADDKPTSQPAQSAQPEQKLEPGQVKLKPEEIEHLGIKTQPLAAATLAPQVQLFGMIQEDPDASFSIRAQVPGTIRAPEGKRWPDIGQVIADNTTIGTIEPRPIPADQIALAAQQATLQTQVATAQADLNNAKVSLAAAKITYDRLKKLNEIDKNVSDRAVQDAQLKVQTEEVHQQGAQNTLKLATDALKSLKSTLAPVPLVIPQGGEVVEINAHPGESIEPGAPVLRVSRFTSVIAALFVPASESLSTMGKEAKVTPYGTDMKPLDAVRIGNGPARDPKTKEMVALFRVALQGSNAQVRPGTPVTASISVGGEPLKGVTIPSGSVVRYSGKAWVYVAGENNIYERHEISLDHSLPDGSGWLVTEDLKAGDQIVTSGAAALLSDEINAAFGGGGGD